MNRYFWIVLGVVLMISGCTGGEAEPLPPEMAAKQAAEQAAKKDTGTPGVTTEKAQVGVGIKGTGYGGGMVTEPIHAYFGARERITFQQVEGGIKTFKIWKERYPKDWDEFEQEVLKLGNLQLPELPPGKKYYYDAEKGELMVQTVE